MVKHKNYSNGFLSTIILVVILIILAFCGYQYYKNSENKTVETLKYSNSEFKFSFNYPKSMSLKESSQSLSDGYTEKHIDLYDSNDNNRIYSIKMTKTEFQSGYLCDGIKYDISVNPSKGLSLSNRQLLSESSPEKYKCIDAAFSYNSNNFRFTTELSYGRTADEMSDFNTLESNYKLIVNSWKFE